MEGKSSKNKISQTGKPILGKDEADMDVKKELSQESQKTSPAKLKVQPKNFSTEKQAEGVKKTPLGSEKEVLQKSQPTQNKTSTTDEEKKKKGLYEVRTMQHDMDDSKGKKVSTLSLTEETLSGPSKAEPRNIESIGDEGLKEIALDKETEAPSKEGSIGVSRNKSRKGLFTIRKFFQKNKSKAKKGRSLNLLIILIICIFIGGAVYYVYTSGALSSLSGIEEMFRDLFNRNPDDTSIPVVPTTTEPIVDTPTSTAQQGEEDESKETSYTEAFFEPDDQEVIKLEKLGDFYTSLEESYQKPIDDGKFRRVIISARNDLSTLSLAQAWKTIKGLVLGNKYTELISAEVVENWGLAIPSAVDKKLSSKYNLFFYGQPGDTARPLLIFKIKNLTGLEEEMFLWEETMLYDIKKMFLGVEHGDAASNIYLDNNYKESEIRYLNLPEPNLTIDYCIMPEREYLLISTSRESMWSAIDRIKQSTVSGSSLNADEEIDKWNFYRNEDLSFEIQHPSTWTPIEDHVGYVEFIINSDGENQLQQKYIRITEENIYNRDNEINYKYGTLEDVITVDGVELGIYKDERGENDIILTAYLEKESKAFGFLANIEDDENFYKAIRTFQIIK